jgi:hypothetical protein
MASIIKVDTIQTAAGGTPTAGGLGLNHSRWYNFTDTTICGDYS